MRAVPPRSRPCSRSSPRGRDRSSISQASGSELRLDAKTADGYIALMQQLGLLVALPAWFGNLGKRVVKAPKVHLADSGLHVHLIGADAQRLARDPDVGGPVLETFVVNELLRQAGWAPDG